MTFVPPWLIRFHDRMKLECSSQRIPRTVVLGLFELNCDWLRIPTSQKSFSGSGSQTFFFGGTKWQPEIRLRSQAKSDFTLRQIRYGWLQPTYLRSVSFWGKLTSGSRISASRSDLLKVPDVLGSQNTESVNWNWGKWNHPQFCSKPIYLLTKLCLNKLKHSFDWYKDL